MPVTRFEFSFPVSAGRESQAQRAVERAVEAPLLASLNPKKGQQPPTITLPLLGVVSVLAENGTLTVSSDPKGMDRAATAWCKALTQLPPDALPRAQRAGVGLLKKLPEEPTGNPLVDYGRRRVLDQTLALQIVPMVSAELKRRVSAALLPFQNPPQKP